MIIGLAVATTGSLIAELLLTITGKAEEAKYMEIVTKCSGLSLVLQVCYLLKF